MKQGRELRGGRAMAETVRDLYTEGQTDYSLAPIVVVDGAGNPIGRIRNHDGVIFCCRRGEREIQLTEAFVESQPGNFPRQRMDDLTFVILTLYHEKFKDLPVAFSPTRIKDTLGETVSRAGLRQLRVSESEKFAHVTFFFNGGNNQPFASEEDVRIPSPRGVPFDMVPGLSLDAVAEAVILGIKNGYDLIITNFANGDVIGHTQNREAKIRCAEIVDSQLGEVVQNALAADYVVLVTADHGNLEEMTNADGTPNVSHTANPAPFILIDGKSETHAPPVSGKLADIAPTILNILGCPKAEAMDGVNLASSYKGSKKKKVLLIILDGWGIGKDDDSNPIYLAQTPVWDDLVKRYPYTTLQAAGEAVGLKSGKAGNSEAGHINIGAGRVVLQDDVRLDRAMLDGSFYTNEVFLQTLEKVKGNHSSLHLISLLTEKSSHGSIDYPLALLKMARDEGLEKVFVHVIFDGRSTEPGTAPALLEMLEDKIDEIGVGKIVSGVGRGIALDRDGDYSKTKKAYDLLVNGMGRKCTLG
jgi:2,3-bisphosphoglycerate-independent phosphoglycerate mutase